MENQKLITGTFIDEITYDIPSSNWSKEQWQQDFDNMAEIGIDTLIMIRGGMGDKTVFPSKVFGTEYSDDFAGFVFEEAQKREMDIIFGLYVTNLDWNHGDAAGEIRKNKPFIDEILQRYGQYPNFKGWYLPQETSCDELNICDVMHGLSAMCKDKAPDKSVMISPFFRSKITYRENGFTPEQHYDEWYNIFKRIGNDVDICAFQDGTAPMNQMTAYYEATNKLCKEFNIRHWVNTETFERDVRNQLYPIPFSDLKRKLELHQSYAEKIITFEFSHFLSPQSIYPSARNLNSLYRDYYKL